MARLNYFNLQVTRVFDWLAEENKTKKIRNSREIKQFVKASFCIKACLKYLIFFVKLCFSAGIHKMRHSKNTVTQFVGAKIALIM